MVLPWLSKLDKVYKKEIALNVLMIASFGIMTLSSKLSHLKVKPAKRKLTKIRVRS